MPPEQVPSLAQQALADGCQSQAVAVLAGTTGDSRRSIEDLLPPVLRDLGLRRLGVEEALKVVVDDAAKQITTGAVEPFRGARYIWALASERELDDELWVQMRPFIGLASEWEDDLDHRPQYEADILQEARALLDRGGLSV